MATILTLMLIVHIMCGFAALITGTLSMLNRKGGPRHRRTGTLFFAGMTGVFITAVFIAIAKDLAFLLMVGFFSYYLACSGYRILYLKKLHAGQRPALIDWVISGIGMVAGLTLIVFSYSWFWHRGAWGLVPLLFGTFCLLNGLQDIRSFYHPPKNKQHWITTHGGRMGGSYAATFTAFIVTNVHMGSLDWLLWIAPGVGIGIWISSTIRHYLQPRKAKVPLATEATPYS